MAAANSPDLILHSGRFTTLDRSSPNATAVAIANGKFAAVGAKVYAAAKAQGLGSEVPLEWFTQDVHP